MGERYDSEHLTTVTLNSHVYYREGPALKKIIPQGISREFTYLVIINEDYKTPNGLILSHLPNGPTAQMKSVLSVNCWEPPCLVSEAVTPHG